MILTEWKKLGESINKQDINAAFIGKGDKYIFVIACMHGDEKQGKTIALKTLAYFEENKLLLQNKQLIIIPVLNPDGYSQNNRGNARGVDINRNFPAKNWEHSKEKNEFYPGESPASEPETLIIINLIEKYKPELIINLHQPYKLINFDGPAEKYADLMTKLNHYKIQKDIGYQTPGSLGTYAGIERNIPVITLELPENEPDDTVWRDNYLAIIATINHT
jgi:protein MpaA